MHIFYVDVPYDYDYKFDASSQLGDAVLTRDFGVKFKFICNGGGGISKGDAHRVEVNSEAEETFILVKTGWTKLNNKVVKDYFSKQYRDRKEGWVPA